LEPLYLGDERWVRFKCAAAKSCDPFCVEKIRGMSLARRLGFCENGVEHAVSAVFEGGDGGGVSQIE
jgi:hypothetical protein